MATSRRVTQCRICSPLCGIVVDVTDGRVTAVTGDPDHPLTRGFTCTKGRHLGELHHAPDRFLTAQRNGPGGFQPLPTDVALTDIAARLRSIVDDHGPEAVALFIGTSCYQSSLTYQFAGAWLRAVGSHKRFSTMTIDQSAKWVAVERIGSWSAGDQRFEDADVWLLAGTNPLVSMQGGELTGFPVHDGLRRLEEARRRGLRLIVVDPRLSEVAAHADLHLQLVPGTDPALFAALLQVIFAEGLHDDDFCSRWAEHVEELRTAVDPMTPDAASEITGVEASLITEAARVFGRAARGMSKSGTGPDMGPHANVAEHLVHVLNVVCGRYPRAGDRAAFAGVLAGTRVLHAQAHHPTRSWRRGFRSRTGVTAINGELPSPALPDEILEPGDDRVRALVVAGGNPAAVFPEQGRIVEALRALELLVVLEPFPTETARLAHYVIAPTMSFERPDDTRAYERWFSEPFAQSSPAILDGPGDVIEDWACFFELTSRMGLASVVGDRVWQAGQARPTTEELLESFARRSTVPYAEVRGAPHGKLFAVDPIVVLPPVEGANDRFDVLADDVATEVHAALDRMSAPRASARPYLLVVRRARGTMNSLGRGVIDAVNPCFVHPDDLASLGVSEHEVVTVTSDHGRVTAVVAADPTLRRGVVALTHAFGGLPGDVDDPERSGTNPSRLLSLTDDRQPISAMPWMSAVPVTITPAPRRRGSSDAGSTDRPPPACAR